MKKSKKPSFWSQLFGVALVSPTDEITSDQDDGGDDIGFDE